MPYPLTRNDLLDLNPTLVRRILEKIRIPNPTAAEPNPCWLWDEQRAQHNAGYGRIRAKLPILGQQVVQATRLMYALQYDEMPTELYACHQCRNKGCVNPSHLLPGPDEMNKDDRRRMGDMPDQAGIHIGPFHPWEGFGLNAHTVFWDEMHQGMFEEARVLGGGR